MSIRFTCYCDHSNANYVHDRLPINTHWPHTLESIPENVPTLAHSVIRHSFNIRRWQNTNEPIRKKSHFNVRYAWNRSVTVAHWFHTEKFIRENCIGTDRFDVKFAMLPSSRTVIWSGIIYRNHIWKHWWNVRQLYQIVNYRRDSDSLCWWKFIQIKPLDWKTIFFEFKIELVSEDEKKMSFPYRTLKSR